MLLNQNRADDQAASPRSARAIMSEAVDVLVVGLGPAGACAAAQAARGGCSVMAVDRKRVAGVPVQCAELVPAMIGMHVHDVAHAVRQPIAAMHTFVADDPVDVTAPFPGQMLDRAAFDAGLVAAATRAGARCVFDAGVRAIAGDGTVTLTDARRVRPRVLIGADGPRSVVGRAIGSINAELLETRQITVPLLAKHSATDIYLSAATPGGYGWMFPRGDVANVGAGVDAAHKRTLKAIVAQLHASLVERGQVGAQVFSLTGGAIPAGGMLTPVGQLGATVVLLAGDAAGLTNPITGAGIVAAVQSGRLAGEAGEAWLGGEAGALEDYRDELESLFGRALERAVHRRRELARSLAQNGVPGKVALRRSWIAYPQYWAPLQAAAVSNQTAAEAAATRNTRSRPTCGAMEPENLPS